MTDAFDLLVANARSSNNTENLDALYGAFFALNEWNFIVSQASSMEDARPFIGLVDEKPWLFVFTDGVKAQQYAKAAGGFLEQDGNTVILRMEAENSMDIARQLNERGVYGIRVNEGENGWYFDIPGMFQIHDYLANKLQNNPT